MAGAIHWRHWVGEELQEVRVTCNEQDVLETAVQGAERRFVPSNSGNELFSLHRILLLASNIFLSHKSIEINDYKGRKISGFICKKRCPSSVLCDV